MKIPLRQLLILFIFSIYFQSHAKEDLSKAYNAIFVELNTQSLERSKSRSLEFLAQAKTEENEYYIVKAYYLLAWMSEKTEDFGDAVIYYLEGARFAELSSNPELKKELISIYKNLGVLTGNYSHYELSHRFIDKALGLAKNTNNQKQVISLLHNRVHEFLDEERYEEALVEINHLLNDFDLDQNKHVQLTNKHGVVLMNLGNYEKARESFQSVISNGIDVNKEEYAHSMRNLALTYMKEGEYSKALAYLYQVIDFNQANELYQLVPESCISAAEAHMAINENQEALKILSKAEQLDLTTFLNPDTYKLYKITSDIHKLVGNNNQALAYNNMYAQKLESYIHEKEQIEELDKKFNIQLLTERYFDLLAANEKRQETERLAKISVGGVTSFFLIVLCLVFYRQKRVKNAIQREILKIEALSKV